MLAEMTLTEVETTCWATNNDYTCAMVSNGRCVKCKSKNMVEIGKEMRISGKIYKDVACLCCGATWTEEYSLTKIEMDSDD